MLTLPTILLVADPFIISRTQRLEELGFNVKGVTGFHYPQVLKKELPREYSQRVAKLQIEFMHDFLSNDNKDIDSAQTDQSMIGIVTVVYCGRTLVGQYIKTDQELQATLQKLSGRRHRVLTTMILKRGSHNHQRQVETAVIWKRLSLPEIKQYIESNQQVYKVGGYLPVSLKSEQFIKAINGMPSNLMGLPMMTLANMLNGQQ